ncbi:glycosyltransferase family 2 protein [Streptococcus sp. X16XC17]|uniref:glycosyltransferase family 2 protein n=1 Tax=unclassified Streptococcus TaxID=2608887 RepID=UPI00066FF829|nr:MULTISPECIES: glycosyltransferase family 2 protein [unclassified Streptococcus]TCD46265.1 glycosyltransferase family 2 protein [Streptococcus sp. X16XC17]
MEKIQKKHNPLISLIIPVYNGEHYLKRCLDSVISQSYKNLEIILVNDGSTDASLDICEQYLHQDNRIKVITQNNQGQSAARNKGLDVCLGEFISFLDSDDWIGEDYIQNLYSILVEEGAELAITGLQIVFENSAFVVQKETVRKVLVRDEAIKECCMNNYQSSVCVKLYKREIWENLRFPVGEIFEDYLLSIKVLEKVNKVVLSNSCDYAYFQRNDSTMNKKIDKRILLMFQRFDEVFEILTGMTEKFEAYARYNILSHSIGWFRRTHSDIDLQKKFFKKIENNRDLFFAIKQKKYGKFFVELFSYLGFPVCRFFNRLLMRHTIRLREK